MYRAGRNKRETRIARFLDPRFLGIDRSVFQLVRKQINIVLPQDIADAAAFVEETTTTAYLQEVVAKHLAVKAKDPRVAQATRARIESRGLKTGAVADLTSRRRKGTGKDRDPDEPT
jgi:hypothetical protein